LDVEKTGYLSKENLRAVLPKTMKDEEIDKLMAEVIVSEDGRVSFEDFKKAFRSDRQKKIDEVYDSKPTKKHGLGA
jgi:Ca2+-binding EF-hand superfamily protein